jgi:hypothetical protein
LRNETVGSILQRSFFNVVWLKFGNGVLLAILQGDALFSGDRWTHFLCNGKQRGFK